MLTMDRHSRGRRAAAPAIVLAVVLLIIPTATTLAAEGGQAGLEITPANERGLDLAQASLDELREEVGDLLAQNDALQADNSSLQQTVDALTSERDRLEASLEHFEDLYDPLEADRQLLTELRKDLPETRAEAEAQLDRIQRLALSSDPARLGQIVDRVSDAAPAFLDWRFTEFGSTQEASQAYVNTGANAFDSTMNEFRSAVLLAVANRLDGLLHVLDRVR
jgi:predicted nuclease with TOPRIM domain